MAKQLKFAYGGKNYTLEYTRKTVSELERRGFIAAEVNDKPMTNLPILFEGAFLANHRFVKKELIDEIYDKMTDKESLIGKLVDMYQEPILTLLQEPEGNEGNVKWTADF